MSLKKFSILLFFIIFVLGSFLVTKKLNIQPKKPENIPAFSPIAQTNKNCPPGFIKVPGNSLYKTSDFCVMKYDAKCTNIDPKCVNTEGVYRNDLPGCTCQGNFHVVSKPDGAPITFIPEISSDSINAKSYCQKEGWHLLTNNEWMTIARNAEQVDANWCGKNGENCGYAPGTPGKILANGHNDSTPNRALEAGSDSNPTYGTLPNPQKRTLTLSNGEIIWDFAGNVWQWIDITIARKDEPRTIIPGFGNSRWTWGEFQTVPYSNDFDPSNPAWNSNQGVGRIYHFNSQNDTDETLYTYIRGGNWRHGYDSGAFTIHMQPIPTKTGIDDIGFRCAVSEK